MKINWISIDHQKQIELTDVSRNFLTCNENKLNFNCSSETNWKFRVNENENENKNKNENHFVSLIFKYRQNVLCD